MKTLGRILCAIDLEKASEPAFERALSLAAIAEAKLFLLHATPATIPVSRPAKSTSAFSVMRFEVTPYRPWR